MIITPEQGRRGMAAAEKGEGVLWDIATPWGRAGA